MIYTFSTVQTLSQVAAIFIHLANIASMTYMASTNETKNVSENLLAANIVHSKDNEIT